MRPKRSTKVVRDGSFATLCMQLAAGTHTHKSSSLHLQQGHSSARGHARLTRLGRRVYVRTRVLARARPSPTHHMRGACATKNYKLCAPHVHPCTRVRASAHTHSPTGSILYVLRVSYVCAMTAVQPVGGLQGSSARATCTKRLAPSPSGKRVWKTAVRATQQHGRMRARFLLYACNVVDYK